MQAMAKAYGLQALVPKPDIKPHIQEAIAKVLLTAASSATLFSCSATCNASGKALISVLPVMCISPIQSARSALVTCLVAFFIALEVLLLLAKDTVTMQRTGACL